MGFYPKRKRTTVRRGDLAHFGACVVRVMDLRGKHAWIQLGDGSVWPVLAANLKLIQGVAK